MPYAKRWECFCGIPEHKLQRVTAGFAFKNLLAYDLHVDLREGVFFSLKSGFER
jgi:hypothetical protein